MDFDRKTIFAFILIGLILILANTSFYQKLVDPRGYEMRQQRKQQMSEPVTPQEKDNATILSEIEEKPIEETLHFKAEDDKISTAFLPAKPQEDERIITIESDLYKAAFSSIGASLKHWELKKYPGVDEQSVQLFPRNESVALSLGFKTRSGDSLSTEKLSFVTDSESLVSLTGHDTYTLVFELSIGEARKIRKSFTFYNDQYAVHLQVDFENMQDIIADKRYVLAATKGLASTEKHLKDDMMYAKAATASGGEVQKNYKSNGKIYQETGAIDWVAVRTKYFAFYIIPEKQSGSSAEIKGEEISISSGLKDKWKKYSIKLAMPYLGERSAKEEFLLFLGPLEYDILKKYNKNLQDFMDFGWGPIKWFSLPILKTLKWMHNFIPNYGVVLLIFALLIKIIVYPLTHKSFESMQKMQALQPKLKEVQEKYKNDPQKLNQATMALYKKEGVNPMGGCLPMLIQMPLLFGLFIVFRSTIELRGEGFFLWITDLSAPDTIYTFPGNFSLPLYGNTINILPLVMGATMFIQQKMTVTDPKQKIMVYFMPIFLTLLFNSFPSGLNLYYALFNILSIVQQKYLTPKKEQKVSAEKVLTKRNK